MKNFNHTVLNNNTSTTWDVRVRNQGWITWLEFSNAGSDSTFTLSLEELDGFAELLSDLETVVRESGRADNIIRYKHKDPTQRIRVVREDSEGVIPEPEFEKDEFSFGDFLKTVFDNGDVIETNIRISQLKRYFEYLKEHPESRVQMVITGEEQ